MAAFREHVTFSGLLGLGYGCGAVFLGHYTPQQGALAGCLAGVAGMLPDLDSPTGKPGQEIFSLTAAVAPLVLVGRVQSWLQLPHDAETTMVCMVAMYLGIRYGLSALVNRFSVHRGMFHSIPAMLIAAELVYLGYPSGQVTAKLLMAGGIALGFFSHLLLDEIWSVQWQGALPHFKKSAGTAIKMVGNGFMPNVVTFALLATLSFLVLDDAGIIAHEVDSAAPATTDGVQPEAMGTQSELVRQAALPDAPSANLGTPAMSIQTPDASLNIDSSLGIPKSLPNVPGASRSGAPEVSRPVPPPSSPSAGLESLFSKPPARSESTVPEGAFRFGEPTPELFPERSPTAPVSPQAGVDDLKLE
ncbi:MAG: metal-dependent hydrolase [Planctomycetaceae bacterium]|nr:metal-dependent hydrolase [Planctomycetaceae bacterium]